MEIITDITGPFPDPVPFSLRQGKFRTIKFKINFSFLLMEGEGGPISVNIMLTTTPPLAKIIDGGAQFQFRQIIHGSVRTKELIMEFPVIDDDPFPAVIKASVIEVNAAGEIINISPTLIIHFVKI